MRHLSTVPQEITSEPVIPRSSRALFNLKSSLLICLHQTSHPPSAQYLPRDASRLAFMPSDNIFLFRVAPAFLTIIFDNLLELAFLSDCQWKPKAGFDGLFIIYLFTYWMAFLLQTLFFARSRRKIHSSSSPSDSPPLLHSDNAVYTFLWIQNHPYTAKFPPQAL